MEHIKVNCEIDIENFTCPLTGELLFEPVIADDGHLYEKQVISTWLSNNDISPITRQYISDNLKDCYVIKNIIDELIKHTPELKKNQYKPDMTFHSNISKILNYIDNNRYDKLLEFTEYDAKYLVDNGTWHIIISNAGYNIVKYVIDNCINFYDDMHEPLIFETCEYASDEIICYIIDKYNDEYAELLNFQNVTGWTILHILCQRNLYNSIKKMIDRNVNLELETDDGWRPIHASCFYCDEKVIKLLLTKKVNIQSKIRKFNGEISKFSCTDLIKMNNKLNRENKDQLCKLIYRLNKPKSEMRSKARLYREQNYYKNNKNKQNKFGNKNKNY